MFPGTTSVLAGINKSILRSSKVSWNTFRFWRRCFPSQTGTPTLPGKTNLSAMLRFLKIECKVIGMKHNAGTSVKQPNRKAISLIAAIMLVLPISASVLCISPDGHVAIESLDADCCASGNIPAREIPSPYTAVRSHDECLNCTDLFILSNELATVQRCYDFSAAGAFADGSCQMFPEAIAASLSLPQKEYPRPLISPPAASAVPLRC